MKKTIIVNFLIIFSGIISAIILKTTISGSSLSHIVTQENIGSGLCISGMLIALAIFNTKNT